MLTRQLLMTHNLLVLMTHHHCLTMTMTMTRFRRFPKMMTRHLRLTMTMAAVAAAAVAALLAARVLLTFQGQRHPQLVPLSYVFCRPLTSLACTTAQRVASAQLMTTAAPFHTNSAMLCSCSAVFVVKMSDVCVVLQPKRKQ